MPNSGLELRVETVADELVAAVHAGDQTEGRRIVNAHADIGGLLIAELYRRSRGLPHADDLLIFVKLAQQCPALPVTDSYAARRQRVEMVRAMQAEGVPERVIQARIGELHRRDIAS